jgi:hypothetical protein
MRTKTKAFLIGLFSFVLVFFGCSTTSAFTGPVSDQPTISISYMRHFEMTDPRLPQQLVTIATANVTNASTSPMTVVLDCDRTFTSLTIAPRTTEHVLLDPKDTSCTVSR